MLELEGLVVEFLTVNALAAGPVVVGKVSALEHELLDHSVESASLVVQGRSGLADSLLTGAKSPEVVTSPRSDIVKQLDHDPAELFVLAIDSNVQEDDRPSLGLALAIG